MTELNDDKPKTQKEKSFKEQILAELEEANRLRKQHEIELRQKEKEAEEFARRTAQLMAEYEAEDRREREEARIREEKRRLEEKAKEALAHNQIEPTVDNQKIKDVLRNIDQTFNPNGTKSDATEGKSESYLVRATDGIGADGNPDISDKPKTSGESESKDDLHLEHESGHSDAAETDLENKVGKRRKNVRRQIV
ncbi:protein YceG like protein [Streptococcus sp. HSISB1]|nr:protein YceG like protein [Streptococcus sp. HSISB1]